MNSNSELETRSGSLATPRGTTVEGYAAVFNSPTQIGDFFIEKIAPGAFTNSIRGSDVAALLGHDDNRILGRQSNGTLKLNEDARGLHFTLELDPDSPEGQTAIAAIRRRDIVGCSFGFQVLAESWEEGDRLPIRTLEEIRLFEISAVAFPAYNDTSVAVKAQERASAIRRQYPTVEVINDMNARQRIAARRAAMEQAFRGIG